MYITFRKPRNAQTFDFETLYKYLQEDRVFTPEVHSTGFYRTFTIDTPTAPSPEQYPIWKMLLILLHEEPAIDHFLTQDPHDLYESFTIPKRKGGHRIIDAPKPTLKNYFRDLKSIFETKLFCLAHDCAYAYIQGRSTIDALQVHQRNNSRWFLKIDLQDFFPSCTEELIYTQLIKLFPFSEIVQQQEGAGERILKKIIKLCCYNGHLPQGTPMSPLLTNLIMIPIDCQLQQLLHNTLQQTFKYTRYADDILISCRYDFQYQALIQQLKPILEPFQIKPEKTRYGSSSGRNWNLGLMLNNQNKITIGHNKKHNFKATLHNFFSDFTNDNPWDIMETQILIGNIAYFKKIEPEYIEYLIQRYEQKFNLNFKRCIKEIMHT